MSKENKFVSITGLTGCGKSTAAEILMRDYQFELVPEKFEGNPFLAPFYEDMQRWAFPSQLYFLLKKIEQMNDIQVMLDKANIVQDFPIYQDLIYANVHNLINNMSSGEWDLYRSVYQLAEEKIITPDLLIFLNVSPEEALSRITQRGREAEQSISISYLTTLYIAITDWLESDIHIPVLEIDGEKLNLADDQDDIEIYKAKVETALGSL